MCPLDSLLLRQNAEDGKLIKTKFDVSHAKRTKRSNFYTGFWKGSSGRVSNWFWKKPDSSGVNSYERNYGRETFERSCRLSAATYCLWANGISILDRINGSYAHGLSFGGYIVRQISTRIYISGERFGEAIFFVDEEKENNHTQPILNSEPEKKGGSAVIHTYQDSLTTKPSTTGTYIDCFLQKLYKPTTRSVENT
ncbi:hypothetical protein pdam_00010018 [Pocillopora damicornis]|uniref:Uncharacterized protein n=1 Tax=Pocillopora damicornis TaxID=46731 RepID=A0A3M6T548_POCDA|nr:hypothetical protein pdam_00010018 [Pocillopora damicornis]